MNATPLPLEVYPTAEPRPSGRSRPIYSQEWAFVPGGDAVIGSNQGAEAEGPERVVQVAPFWLAATPVTNQEFESFVDATGYVTSAERRGQGWGWREGRYQDVAGLSWRSFSTEERRDHPVVGVSWWDADAYARWLGARLPTEIEWEVAARAGRADSLFPWGLTLPDGSQSNWARAGAELPPTTSVRAFPANAWGLYDMVGNVWQWCADELPSPEGAGPLRARRGGAWNVIQAFRLRCSNRGALSVHATAPNLGFRCARDA